MIELLAYPGYFWGGEKLWSNKVNGELKILKPITKTTKDYCWRRSGISIDRFDYQISYKGQRKYLSIADIKRLIHNQEEKYMSNYTEYTVRYFDNEIVKHFNSVGQIHNEHGPAICSRDPFNASVKPKFYINGVELSYEEWKKRVAPAKEMTVEEISKALGYNVKIVKG